MLKGNFCGFFRSIEGSQEDRGSQTGEEGMRPGDQYPNELKLVHIEEGFDMPPAPMAHLRLRFVQEGHDKKQGTHEEGVGTQVPGHKRGRMAKEWCAV